MIPWKLVLKNIRGYRKRSVVTVVLSAITTALLVFSSAIMDGSHNTMIKNAVEIYPGYMQITHRDFRDTPGYENLIFDLDSLRRSLANIPDIAAYGARFETYVLYSTEARSVGGMLTGIEPRAEKQLSRMASSLYEGEYLDDEDGAVVYIGFELAKRLKVGIGDELAFIGNGADYSMAADVVTVKGTFRTGLFDFDASAAFMNKRYLDEVMVSRNMATHVIVLPANVEDCGKIEDRINQEVGGDNVAESWFRTMASLVQAMKLDSVFGYITLGIIFIVIFFVIMIYTLLTVYARVREVGVMRAIGTTPWGIFVMLVSESVLLSLVGVLLGGLLGACVAYYFYLNPMEFAGYEEQFKQYNMVATAIPADFAPLVIARDMLIMFVLCVCSTLYPILRLNRYRPMDAIRHV
ncbi:MAG: FtsX-like permease family protein [Desulfobulbaceae bacterium]|nr:FtsX-like permease family protein [Desulfobulbaceae bacterium]